jgi:hypothetical protein
MKLFLVVLLLCGNISSNSLNDPFCNPNVKYWLKTFYGNSQIAKYIGSEKLILDNGIESKPIKNNEGVKNREDNMRLLLDLSYTYKSLNNKIKLEFYGPDSFVYFNNSSVPNKVFQIFQCGPDSIVTDVFWVNSKSFVICSISEESGNLIYYDLNNMEIKSWVFPSKISKIWDKFKLYLKIKEAEK